MAPIRAVLDSNAVDEIAEPSGRYEAIQAAVDDGRLVLLWTHITVEELLAIPDEERRSQLTLVAAAVCRMVPTGAMVLGYSRLGFCRLGADEDGFEAFRSGNLRHTADALIASTAQHEQCPIVTSDHRLTRVAAARGVTVWTPDVLFEHVAAAS